MRTFDPLDPLDPPAAEAVDDDDPAAGALADDELEVDAVDPQAPMTAAVTAAATTHAARRARSGVIMGPYSSSRDRALGAGPR